MQPTPNNPPAWAARAVAPKMSAIWCDRDAMFIPLCPWCSSPARILLVGVGWVAEGSAFGGSINTKMPQRQKEGGE